VTGSEHNKGGSVAIETNDYNTVQPNHKLRKAHVIQRAV